MAMTTSPLLASPSSPAPPPPPPPSPVAPAIISDDSNQHRQQSSHHNDSSSLMLSTSEPPSNGELGRVQFANSTTATSTGYSSVSSFQPIAPLGSSSSSSRRASTVTAASLSKRSVNGSATLRGSQVQPSAAKDSDHLQKLSILKDLLDQGYIAEVEYNERKSQLIDQLTGTGSNTGAKRSAARPVAQPVPQRAPPDFSKLPSERAIKHTFDPLTQSWVETNIRVKIDIKPFAKGGLRYAFYMVVDSDSVLETVVDASQNQDEKDKIYVAKISIDPEEDRESYWQDVEIQMYAKEWAKKFNSYNPPKKVEFLKAYVLELADREGRPICGVERYIDGPYRKHNNNFGYVSEDERNTPQAFSHFTYHGSNHSVLVCDIQGVGDLYTDPQMHTNDEGFGKGNLGQRGFEKFLATHRCNAICRYLGLPAINAKQLDEGTKPAQTFMDRRGVYPQDTDYGRVPTSDYLPPGQRKPVGPETPLLRNKPPPMDLDTSSCCCVVS